MAREKQFDKDDEWKNAGYEVEEKKVRLIIEIVEVLVKLKMTKKMNKKTDKKESLSRKRERS